MIHDERYHARRPSCQLPKIAVGILLIQFLNFLQQGYFRIIIDSADSGNDVDTIFIISYGVGKRVDTILIKKSPVAWEVRLLVFICKNDLINYLICIKQTINLECLCSKFIYSDINTTKV